MLKLIFLNLCKSIVLSLAEKYDEKRKSHISQKGAEPKDFLYLVHILCFFLGFMMVVPLVFFSTAQSYWMYKFRNTTIDAEITKGTDRTVLQSYYQSVSMVATTVPSVIVATLVTVYGHKVSAMFRTASALVVFCLLYFTFTIFTQINTDSWQTGFFIMTMGLLTINSVAMAVFQISSIVLLPKLPHQYMFFFLLGQNGTVFTTALQIVSLVVTDRSVTSGLIYFSAGTFLIAVTLLLLLVARKSEIFKYYEVGNVEQQNNERLSWSESKELMKKIWPCILIPCLLMTNMSFIQPAITTLIVSQNDGDGSDWTGKFFTPVIVFLLIEITSIMGRAGSQGLYLTHSNKWWYISLALIRYVSIPFYIFCNAQPRHLPVIFDKDWEFIIFHICNGLSIGMLMNVAFMSIKSLAGNKQEASFKLINLSISIILSVTAANGVAMVKVL